MYIFLTSDYNSKLFFYFNKKNSSSILISDMDSIQNIIHKKIGDSHSIISDDLKRLHDLYRNYGDYNIDYVFISEGEKLEVEFPFLVINKYMSAKRVVNQIIGADKTIIMGIVDFDDEFSKNKNGTERYINDKLIHSYLKSLKNINPILINYIYPNLHSIAHAKETLSNYLFQNNGLISEDVSKLISKEGNIDLLNLSNNIFDIDLFDKSTINLLIGNLNKKYDVFVFAINDMQLKFTREILSELDILLGINWKEENNDKGKSEFEKQILSILKENIKIIYVNESKLKLGEENELRRIFES